MVISEEGTPDHCIIGVLVFSSVMITDDDSKDFTTVAVVTGIVSAVGIITVVVIFTGSVYFWYSRKKTTQDGNELQFCMGYHYNFSVCSSYNYIE